MFDTYTTGNLWFALPRIAPPPAGLDRLAFLMMAHRGLIQLVPGDGGGPSFLTAEIRLDGRPARDRAGDALIRDWIPVFRQTGDGCETSVTWLAPSGERGVLVRAHVANTSAGPVNAEAVFRFRWGETWVSTYTPERFDGRFSVDPARWAGGAAIAWVASRTQFALGVGCGDDGEMLLEMFRGDSMVPCWSGDPRDGRTQKFDPDARMVLECRRAVTVQPGEAASFDLFFSIAQDAKAAAFDVRHLRAMGFDRLLSATERRLAELNRDIPPRLDDDPQLGPLVRRNRLFCYYYSLGLSLDTEEICPVTSRSSDYYVSAAYWDRDSLLWSFPTILEMDRDMARRVLRTAFGRQGRNIGTHSRFIDGSIYEPGFELDELCAPVIALDRYLRVTNDWGILDHTEFDERLGQIERELVRRRHPDIALYSTEYLPTDDLDPYPYCIYDNALVWTLCGAMKSIAEHRGQSQRATHWGKLGESVREAIWTHGIVRENEQADSAKLFAWSVDLQGRFRLYDEPPGSLALLAWYGFCAAEDPIYQATLKWIYSRRNPHYFPQADEIGCLHEPHPWVLALANSLLLPQRRASALALLRRSAMDQGIACEAIDETTGQAVSGKHFATCAGFLCHALVRAYETE